MLPEIILQLAGCTANLSIPTGVKLRQPSYRDAVILAWHHYIIYIIIPWAHFFPSWEVYVTETSATIFINTMVSFIVKATNDTLKIYNTQSYISLTPLRFFF